MDFQKVLDDAKRILTDTADQANAVLKAGQKAEAKRLVTGDIRDLRDLKRDVINAERDVRASFTDQRLNVNKSGQVLGAFAGSKGRAAIARGRAFDKRKIAERQAAATKQFTVVKKVIDDFIDQLDDAKFKIDSAMAREREAGKKQPAAPKAPNASAVPPPPTTPAGWGKDPFGRHQQRYWDGTAWTEHVADGDIRGTDPPTPTSA